MGLRCYEICIDAVDATGLGKWWSQALGWPFDVDEDGDRSASAGFGISLTATIPPTYE